ncbi:hypothetical protein EON64_00190 [archaeon]|nr:MAG: hypothetical protein EON64_00190 [archaeon]
MHIFFQLLHLSLTANDDETLIEGLGMLQDLSPLPLPLLNDYMGSLIELCLHILRHTTIEESVKAAAGQCLIDLIENKPKLFSKQGGVNSTLLTCMEIIAQDKSNAAGSLFALPVVQQGDEGKLTVCTTNTRSNSILRPFVLLSRALDSSSDVSDDSHQFSLQSLSQSIIDAMSLNIPPKYFVESALGLCSQVSCI